MVTIGLPVYNAERWIVETIESILAQTLIDWELVVTDDGSTDQSVEKVKSYLSDKRITLVCDGEHQGISARINQQVAMARGEFFARMDADDVMMPERLALQVKYLQEHPEVDVCGTGAGEWTFIHPTVMGRTEWFRNHPYRSECDGCEDWDLWLRTKKCSAFGYLDDPLIYYRQSEQLDKKKYLIRRRQGRKAIRMNRDLLPVWRYYWLLLESYLKSAWVWL